MSLLRTHNVEDVLLVYFTDPQLVGTEKVSQVDEELTALAENSEGAKLALNFGHVKFMSSAILGSLVTFGNRCKASKIRLTLCSISPEVIEAFRLTGLDKKFDIFDDEEEATEALNKRRWFG